MLDRWRWVFALAFVGSLVLVIAGSLTPSQQMPPASIDDKLIHFGAYATVGLLATLTFRRRAVRLLCFFLLAVTGVALEFGQTHVPGRSFELWDMVANGMGVLYGYSIPGPDGNSPRNRLVDLEPAGQSQQRSWS